jgi:hypothetical protein
MNLEQLIRLQVVNLKANKMLQGASASARDASVLAAMPITG